MVCVKLVEDVDNDGMILKASKTNFMTRALSKLPKAILATSGHVHRPWLFPISRSAHVRLSSPCHATAAVGSCVCRVVALQPSTSAACVCTRYLECGTHARLHRACTRGIAPKHQELLFRCHNWDGKAFINAFLSRSWCHSVLLNAPL